MTLSAHPPCWCGGTTSRVKELGQGAKLLCLDSKFHDPESDGRPTQIDRLYIAGPMSGYPGNNYDTFHAAADQLRDLGFIVVNPAEFGAEGGGHYTDLIRKDLREMLDCHGVATLENWWESAGARNEVMAAGLMKMPVRSVFEWTMRVAWGQELAHLKKENA